MSAGARTTRVACGRSLRSSIPPLHAARVKQTADGFLAALRNG